MVLTDFFGWIAPITQLHHVDLDAIVLLLHGRRANIGHCHGRVGRLRFSVS
jgi:hypothetical protein